MDHPAPSTAFQGRRFPLPVLYVDMREEGGPTASTGFAADEARSAWHELCASLGEGMLVGIVETPEARGSSPHVVSITEHPDAPVPDLAVAQEAFSEVVFTWRFAIEELMNRRWDMVDNPYARFCVSRTGILIHEDPLTWLVDTHGKDLSTGDDLDTPRCALLVPLAATGHAQLAAIAAATGPTLPHAALFDADLSAAAEDNGQDHLLPLRWAPVPTMPDSAHTLALDDI